MGYLLLLVNICVFLVELTRGEPFIAAYSAVHYEISHGVDFTRPVIVPGLGVIPQAPGRALIYLTLFTSMLRICHHHRTHSAATGGGVAYLAHIGGFVTGSILSFFFRRPFEAREFHQ
jgi:membrane associated rhomboid family serine protease